MNREENKQSRETLMIAVKVLSSSDLPLLMNAVDDVFDNRVDEAFAREFLADPRHHIVVALSDGVVIGFASAVHYIHPDKPTELWINEVGVAEAHQNKGVGKALMNELLRLGKQLGCVNAWVLTDRSNEASNRLYKSTGGQVAEGDNLMYEFDIAEKNDAGQS
jgi:GNAT superfamily N-acetyltransferase